MLLQEQKGLSIWQKCITTWRFEEKEVEHKTKNDITRINEYQLLTSLNKEGKLWRRKP